MKKILLIAVAAFISVSVYAQGTVNFSTVGAPGILQAAEKGGGLVPSGATFQAGLFFAPQGVTDDAMFMQVGAPGSFISGGRVFAGTRETPTAGTFNFQVRVWEVADPNHKGSSSIFEITTGNPNAVPATPAAGIVPGFNGLQMSVVPEPSVIALGALGAGALLLLRRRK
jgi:hypothetical protein